jgi:hypothetical protein
MKSKLSLVLASLLAVPAFASQRDNDKDTVPRGETVEVHSCELYTGGCTASAQYDSGGRSLLRIWKFNDGQENGVNLAGLRLGALEVSDENLARREIQPKQTVLYLPAGASAEQREALVAWVKRANPEIGSSAVSEKVAKIEYDRSGGAICAKVGEEIALQTRPMGHCDSGSCGESLWYSPKSNVGRFTVLVDEQCTLSEPAVFLKRQEHGIRSVFFAEFGGVQQKSASFNFAMLK